MNQTTPQTPTEGGAPTAPNPQEGTGSAPQGGGTPPTGAPVPTPAPAGESTPTAAPSQTEDYKEKFAHSTSENQRLMELFKAKGIDPKTGEPLEPTANPTPKSDEPILSDTELEAALPNFSTLGEEEKSVIRNVNSVPKLARMVAEMHDRQVFNDQLEGLQKKQGYEMLKENVDEFKAFAYKPENLKQNIALLADSFILTKTREQAATAGTEGGETPAPTGMENGSSGATHVTPTAQGVVELTAAEATRMRKEDHRRYNKLASEGKLVIKD